MQGSVSENNGLAAIFEEDRYIYSVGISTGGLAEMSMAMYSPNRRIIATTIDQEGASFAQTRIDEAGLSEKIEVKIEDVTTPLSYRDGYFDFVYARLVLHYLSKNKLIKALEELYRVLKKRGKMFVVVRSTDCLEAQDQNAIFNSETGMTTYFSKGGYSCSRFFHDRESIQKFLVASGFHINHVKTYDEQLCVDFQRTQPSEQMDALIEVLASKC